MIRTFISESFAFNRFHGKFRPFAIADVAGVVPKTKFAGIAAKMLLTDIMINASDAAFKY